MIEDLQPAIPGGPAMEEENPFMQNNEEAAAEEAKKKQRRFKITGEDLTEGPNGLNRLYIDSVIRGGKEQ